MERAHETLALENRAYRYLTAPLACPRRRECTYAPDFTSGSGPTPVKSFGTDPSVVITLKLSEQLDFWGRRRSTFVIHRILGGDAVGVRDFPGENTVFERRESRRDIKISYRRHPVKLFGPPRMLNTGNTTDVR